MNPLRISLIALLLMLFLFCASESLETRKESLLQASFTLTLMSGGPGPTFVLSPSADIDDMALLGMLSIHLSEMHAEPLRQAGSTPENNMMSDVRAPLSTRVGDQAGYFLSKSEYDSILARKNGSFQGLVEDFRQMVRSIRQQTVASQSRPWNGTEHLQLRYAKLGRVSGVPFINLLHEDSVSAVLRECGEWESLQTELLQGFLRPGDVAVDVGAHIGTHAVAFARVVGPSGTVYAFEAQPAVYEVLLDNAGIGGVGNMVVRNLAIGNTTAEGGKIAVRVLDVKAKVNAGLEHGNSTLENNFGSLSLVGCHTRDVDVSPSFDAEALVSECQGGQTDREHNHVWVDVVSLDSFGWHVGEGHKCPRVIKIDVEGMETQVLAGGRELLRTCRPILHVENNLEAASPHIIDALTELGYDLYWELSTFSGQDNYFGTWRMSSIEASAAQLRVHLSVNLLGIPTEFNSASSGMFASMPHHVRQAFAQLTPVRPMFSKILRGYVDATAFEYADMTLEAMPVMTADDQDLNSEGVMLYVKKPFKLMTTVMSQLLI